MVLNMRKIRTCECDCIPAKILVVEDNPLDVRLMIETLHDGKISLDFHSVDRAEKCIKFLRKEDEYKDMPTPDVIFLDINLPGISGIDCLNMLKDDENLKHIPVIMLTTSSSDEDILKSYTNHCQAYAKKPVDIDEFRHILVQHIDFWFGSVKLPRLKQL